IQNAQIDSFISGLVATFVYDRNKIEYVEGSGTFLNDNDEAFVASAYVENCEYEKGTKIAFVTIDEENARRTDGKIFKCTFKSVNGESGSIAFGNDYKSVFGYETYITFTNDTSDTVHDGKNLILDKTPLVIGE
ncbi:MAG: hypothetical protein ACI38A_02200, partial [Candidatus Ornithomonoglobus sp.]